MSKSFFSCLAVLFAACSATDPAIDAESISNQSAFCPPIPPVHPNVQITGVSSTTLITGALFAIEGSGFDQLPPNTKAWFFSNNNAFTATSDIRVLSPTRVTALVPSHHLVDGPGMVSLYYTECVDCTSEGGGPNSCAGIWVNPATMKPRVTFHLPTPQPLPVSNLRAVAVSDSEISLTWNDNSNNEDGFEILEGPSLATTNNLLGRVPADRTSEPITNLPPSTLRCYEVRAFNRSGAQPVPIEARACATTFAPSFDHGIVTVSNIFGFDNTMCTGTFQNVRLFASTDSDSDGVVDALGTPARDKPAPAFIEPNIANDPVWDIFLANRYADGANMFLLAQINCIGSPHFVALHMHWDGNATVTPVFLLAGAFNARTGPQNENIGTVMIGSDLTGQMRFDPRTERLTGRLDGAVAFEVEIPDTGVRFESRAHVEIELLQGVEVTRE